MWVDLPRHWAEVDHARIRPVRWQTAEINRAGPFADRLRAPAAEILVHEEGWRLRALSDDRQMIRKWLQRRYVDSVDAYAEEIKRYQALGYDSFFAAIGFWAGDLKGILEVMDAFARKMGM